MSSSAYRRDLGPHEAISFVKAANNISEFDKVWLDGLSRGKSFKELAGECTVTVSRSFTEGAIKMRLKRVRMHLGADNITQAVAEAIRRGIIK
jgi:DNA-binding CsgD family transcriptional regulator